MRVVGRWRWLSACTTSYFWSGPRAHFLFAGPDGVNDDGDRLQELLGPVAQAMGYELLGIEYHAQGRGQVLRAYIDRAGGITLEDCRRISVQFSGVLDVEEPISGPYVLEVSSPGDDRPLFNAEQLARQAGSRVRIQVGESLGERRKFTGRLVAVRGAQVVIEEDGREIDIPLERVAKARVIPE
ncbi:MAG TPA: ribosome maturation factor RimP [Gammaproteobacteria bacterium]|nr:ribosome maturation factor RimP [Gammaproteobacteria bacterium]